MARGRNAQDQDTLQMALVGYQIERRRIDEKIQAIQAQLKGNEPSVAAAKKASGTKRVLSPAARRRIAAAQKRRWAEHRKRIAQSGTKG